MQKVCSGLNWSFGVFPLAVGACIYGFKQKGISLIHYCWSRMNKIERSVYFLLLAVQVDTWALKV